jgi:hypothetical protein
MIVARFGSSMTPALTDQRYLKSVCRPLTRTSKRTGEPLFPVGGFNTSIFGQQLPIGAMLCLRSVTLSPSGRTRASGA